MTGLRYLCTVHNVRFGLEAPADAAENLRQECSWMDCPLCARKEMSQLRDIAAKERHRAKILIDAITIKQDVLVELLESRPKL